MYTANIASHTKTYFDLLTDERTGRLFKNKSLVRAPTETGSSEYAAEITEEDYNAKSTILVNFVAELYQSSKLYVSSDEEMGYWDCLNVKSRPCV